MECVQFLVRAETQIDAGICMCMRMIPVFIGVPGLGLAGSMPGKHIGNYHPVSLVLPPLFPFLDPTVTVSQSKCGVCEGKMIIANLSSLMTAPEKTKSRKSDVLGSIPASHNF